MSDEKPSPPQSPTVPLREGYDRVLPPPPRPTPPSSPPRGPLGGYDSVPQPPPPPPTKKS